MPMTDEMVALAEVCFEANEIVQAYGTPEMKTLMRLLLFSDWPGDRASPS
ncbi:hypothetical protein ACFZ8E_26930 [Methylobacterium sp. HMF5984]